MNNHDHKEVLHNIEVPIKITGEVELDEAFRQAYELQKRLGVNAVSFQFNHYRCVVHSYSKGFVFPPGDGKGSMKTWIPTVDSVNEEQSDGS